MEDVLDRYAEPYDPDRPVVCFDETSTQLLADTRPPVSRVNYSCRKNVHYFCRFTPSAWPRCWAASVR